MKNKVKQIILTEETNELVIAMKELKNLESQVDFYNKKIKELKDKVKATDYSQIFFKNDKEQILCTITKFNVERVSWDKDFLAAKLSAEDYNKARVVKNVESVRITIK